MALIEINHNPSRRELRQFGGIWLPLALAVIGGTVYYKSGALGASLALWGIAVVACLVGWTVPQILRPVWIGWMYAAFPIGWTVSHLLLAVIYYGVVTPIGLVMRLLGRDPMARRFDRSATTYWIPHEPTTDSRRYFRQF